MDGSYVTSNEHIILYPPNTNACSTCLFFYFDLQSERQALKRQQRQRHQGSLTCHNAIQRIRMVTADLEAVLNRHRKAASGAIEYLKKSIEGAATRYKDLATIFADVTKNDPIDDPQEDLHLTATEDTIRKAIEEWYEMSSDCQQNKSVPSWNQLPRTGPKPFISGETHYMHIFCDESAGDTSGLSRYLGYLVYSRIERVGGSKSSDDTLSTLADKLL